MYNSKTLPRSRRDKPASTRISASIVAGGCHTLKQHLSTKPLEARLLGESSHVVVSWVYFIIANRHGVVSGVARLEISISTRFSVCQPPRIAPKIALSARDRCGGTQNFVHVAMTTHYQHNQNWNTHNTNKRNNESSAWRPSGCGSEKSMVPTSNNAMTWQWVQEVAMHRASLMLASSFSCCLQVLLFYLDLAVLSFSSLLSVPCS